MRKEEAKGKGERLRYTQLNARIPENTKERHKGFLSEQCKERKKIEWGKLEISRKWKQ